MKDNIFSNIDTAKNKIKLQQDEGKTIEVKKRGRPRRPNMVKKLIKVDKVLYQQLTKLANEQNTSIAHLISVGIRKVLCEETKK